MYLCIIRLCFRKFTLRFTRNQGGRFTHTLYIFLIGFDEVFVHQVYGHSQKENFKKYEDVVSFTRIAATLKYTYKICSSSRLKKKSFPLNNFISPEAEFLNLAVIGEVIHTLVPIRWIDVHQPSVSAGCV